MTPRAPVVGFVSANRGPVAVALLALGVLCLAASGYCFLKGYGTAAPPPAEGAPPDAAPPMPAFNPNQTEYLGGGVAGLIGAMVGVVLGGAALAKLPPADPEKAKTEARWLLVAAGGLFGVALLFLGLWLLGCWFDVIAKWINDRDASQAWKPLTALLVFLAGAGLAFAAVQPARAEERNNVHLRRLCYGLNFGLSAVLLLVGLVVANVVVGLKLPAQLDTTDEGFYSLDPLTVEFLAGLSQDVTVYTTRMDGLKERQGADIARMLDACRQVNPARLRIRQVSNTDATLIAEMTEKFKGVDFKNEPGIIIATGPKESQYSFLSVNDLFTRGAGGGGGERRLVFQGESKLVNELLYLADNKSKPVVYFTQGSGELQLDGPPGGGDTGIRTCGDLRTAFLKNYIDAKPLTLDPAAPKVPDDAALVVIADPTGPLPAATVAALKNYTAVPGRSGKPGRLLVLAGPPSSPQSRGAIVKTNLNELTAPLGVTIEDKLVYSELLLVSQQEALPPDIAILAASSAMRQERNPIALAAPGSGLPVHLPRLLQVTPAPAGGGPGPAKASPLLGTPPARGTWIETAMLSNSMRTWQELETIARSGKNPQVLAEKQWGKAFRATAAVASDADGKPKMVVFGFADEFSDESTRAADGGGGPHLDLFVAAVNWLRDRPPAASVATKTYGEYRPAKPINSNLASAFWLPVGGLFVVVLFLGLGVWAYRRK